MRKKKAGFYTGSFDRALASDSIINRIRSIQCSLELRK